MVAFVRPSTFCGFFDWLIGLFTPSGSDQKPPHPDDYKPQPKSIAEINNTDYSTDDKAAPRLLFEAYRHDTAAFYAERLGYQGLAEDYRRTAEGLRIFADNLSGGKLTQQGYIDEACAAAAELFAECERKGWLGYECQSLKDALEGCAWKSGGVYDPSPDGEPLACKTPQVTAEQVAIAVLIECEALVRYGPDGGSPCSSPAVGAIFAKPFGVRVVLCPATPTENAAGEGPPPGQVCIGLDPCASEVATPDPSGESCAGEVKVMEVRPSASDAIAAAWSKLGGPASVPRPPPSPMPGGPDPAGPHG